MDHISYSRIYTWKRCWNKYKYKYIDKLRPKEKARPPRLGILGHSGIEAKLKGEDWKEVIREKWDEEIETMPEGLAEKDKEEDIQLIESVLERYFDWFDCFRSDEEKDLVKPEYEFEVKIPGTDMDYNGRFDRVLDVPGEGVWLVDYKFTTSSLNKKLDSLELDEQIDYYIWALNEMLPDKTIQGAIFNAIRLELPTKPQPIKSGKRLSKRQIRTDKQTYVKAIQENGFDIEEYQEKLEELENQDNPFFRTESVIRDDRELDNIEKELRQVAIEMEKTTQFIRSRMSGRCSWDCDYKDLCLAEKRDGDTEAVINDQFTMPKEREDKEDEENEGKPF